MSAPALGAISVSGLGTGARRDLLNLSMGRIGLTPRNRQERNPLALMRFTSCRTHIPAGQFVARMFPLPLIIVQRVRKEGDGDITMRSLSRAVSNDFTARIWRRDVFVVR